MAGLTKAQREAKALANADQNGAAQTQNTGSQDQQGSSTSTDGDGNQGADGILNSGTDTNTPSSNDSKGDDTQTSNQQGSANDDDNLKEPPTPPQTPPTVDENKGAANQISPTTIQNIIKEMEQVIEPQYFSELSYKTELVIKNSNGIEQVVTKRFWEQTREAELDRLQGLELLGIAKFTDREKGEYDILPIEDDWEPAEPEKK